MISISPESGSTACSLIHAHIFKTHSSSTGPTFATQGPLFASSPSQIEEVLRWTLHRPYPLPYVGPLLPSPFLFLVLNLVLLLNEGVPMQQDDSITLKPE